MNLQKELENKSIRVDWKATIDDFVFVATNEWNEFKTISEDPQFLKLITNYNSEFTEDFLQAIGQELSCHNYLLFELIEDADHYCLTLCEMDKNDSFQAELKEAKIEFRLLKQLRKKLGSKAKRVQLANQIPHKKYPLKGVTWFNYPLTYSAQRQYTNGANTGEKNFVVDLNVLPPVLHKSEKITALELNESLGLYAAVFANMETKKGVVKLSKDPLNPESWIETKSTDELHIPSKLGWIDNTLFIIREKEVWTLEYNPTETPIINHFFTSKDSPNSIQGSFPKFLKTNSGQNYVLLNSQFYLWNGNSLSPTGMYALEHTDFNYHPTSQNAIVYVSKGELVEHDFSSKKYRKRLIPNVDAKTTIRRFDKNWAVILRWGHTDKEYPIAIFWNPNSDEWRSIKLGALGKHGIRDIIKTYENTALILGSDEVLIELTELNSIFSDDKFLIQNEHTWNEDWDLKEEINPKASAKNSITTESKSNWFKRLLKK